MEEQMKQIEINIQLDPVTDGPNFLPEKVTNESKKALVIGTNGEYRLIDEDEVYEIFDRMASAMVSESDFMGNTDFLAVFNAKKVLSTGGAKFVVGSVLIVKGAREGIALMDEEEIKQAKTEFQSRLVTLCGSGIQFSAYELG
jgi:hypothetical protein